MRFKYSFALLFAFLTLQLAAQQTSFRISYDIANLDIPGYIIQNPAGNYVFAGTNANFIPLYGNVTQIDSLGNVIWSKGYSGGSVATDIWDIKNVSGGGYITAGSTGSGVMLMRLDANGAVTWSNRYHITSGTNEYSSRVLPTSDGGFVVAGYVHGATPPSSTKQDSANFFCLKVNSSGTFQWSKVFFYTTAYVNDHVLNDVAEVSDGYIFGGSASQSVVDDDGTDAVVLKTDLNGNLQWMKKWGSSSSSQSVNALVSLSASEVMASGDDNSKMFYEKISSSGTSNGGYSYTFPGLLSVATAYNGFVTNDGNYGFIGSDIVPLSFAFNSFVMKVSPANGNVSFARTFNSGLSSILPEGTQVSDSGYIMIMTAQQVTGFNYHVAKCDKSGVMNNTNCESATVSPSKASYAPSFSAVTPSELSSATTSSISVVVANLSPTKVVDCITVQCNNPATPTASASPNPICSGQSTSITGSGSGTGVTYKVYTAATGGTLLGTAPLSVSPTSTTTYYVEAESNSIAGCISLARGSVTVTVNNPPAAVGSITGATSPCPGSQTYSIGSVSGASSYTWSVSGGGSITGGQGSTAVTINWTTAGGPYTVSVTASNSCGNTSSTTSVTVQNGPPAAVGAISGSNNPCPGSQTYSIANVANATSYTWSVSGGGTITGGQGSTSATINWTTSGGPYTVSVVATNSCGTTSNTLSVNVQPGPPAAVGSVTGTTNPCPGSQTYSINAVAGATSYTWAVSAGGTITGGQGTTSATINWTAAGGPYNVSITATNSCGSTSNTLPVTVQNGPPAAVGAITGSTNPCPGSQTYSINNVANATSYSWSVSAGGTITGGQGTTTITINWTSSGGPYTVSVTASNACGSAGNSTAVTVAPPAPVTTGSIAGDTSVCTGNEVYTITPVANATSYTWAISGGGSISNGQGTNSATINWTTAGTYTVSVSATNNCGSSTNAVLTVQVTSAAPTNLGAIAGPSPICHGAGTYTVGTATGSTSYAWTVGTPGTITGGQGSASININWPAVAGTFPVTVTATNVCGNSTTASYSVTVVDTVPLNLGAITGNNNPCPGTGSYSLPAVSGATGYTWTLSGGGTIASGQGTNAIDINWTSTGGPYTLSVSAQNTCGSSVPATLNVTVQNGSAPVAGAITGDTAVCPGNESYSIATVSGATGYNWTVSNGGTITAGSGTNSITVNWTQAGGPYTVSVIVTGSCSNSQASTVAVTVKPGAPVAPGTIAGNITTCGSDTASYAVAAVPNATTYTWNISNGGTLISGQGTNAADILWAATPGTYTISVSAGNDCGTSAFTTLNVSVLPPAPVMSSFVQGDTGVCPGTETYTISSIPNATTYTWQLGSGGTIASGQGTTTVTVDWTTPGTHTLSVTAGNNCGSSQAATLQVNVHPNPTQPTITLQNDTICQGQQTTITASGSAGGTISYTYYDAAPAGNIVGTNPLTVNPSSTTTYYLEVSNQFGCIYSNGRVPVTVVVLQAPTVTIAAGGDTVCFGSTATLGATPTPGNAVVSWFDAATAGNLLGTGNTYTAGPLSQSTTIYAQVSDANGCAALSGRVPATVEVKALPVVTLSSDKDNNTLLPGEAITFTASPAGYGNYEFFVNGVSVQSGSDNTWASSKLSDKDTVSVIATDNGCSSYASDGVVHVVDFPNAFTPNNDGTNDVFLKNYDLIILNRWGQELYRGHDGWDGTYNGDKASPGTYYYIVTLKNITDRDTQVKGNVLLIQD